MKRVSLLAASIVVSIGVALGVVGLAQAQWSDNLKASDSTVTIAQDDTHTGALYVSAEKLVIDGSVEGDLYCAASEVVVSGTVTGDVICAAQSITIRGSVDSIRATAQYVTLEGVVEGSVSTLAQDVRVGGDATIAGELNGLAQMAIVDGKVAGGLALSGGSLKLNGSIGEDVDISFGSIDVGEGAIVGGDFNYSMTAREEIQNLDGVAGAINFNQAKQRAATEELLGGLVLMLVMMLLAALAVVLAIPRFVHRASEVLRENTLNTVLLGFAFAFAGPILMLLLFLTVFLAPLAVMLLLAWLLISSLSGIFFAYYIGSALLRGVPNVVLRMMGGAIVLLILYLIPIVNIFVLFAAWVVGSGMIIKTLTAGYRRPDYRLEVDEPAAKPTKKRSASKTK